MEPGSRLLVAWAGLASVCCVLMWFMPGSETIPYHLAWIGLAAAYGIEPWPRSRAYGALVGLTLVSGVVLVNRAAVGVLPWDETAEIPLMAALMALVIWHVRRRHEAFAELTAIAARDGRRAAQRERLSRMTSHELRTPATIAVGHLELLLSDEADALRRADFGVVLEELDRVLLGTDRLIRMLWIPELDELETVDIDQALDGVCDRWRVVARRDWQVVSTAGVQLGSRDRIRSCMDTLLENSVRYTEPGDVIRLVSFVRGNRIFVGVEDGGPGFDQGMADMINTMEWEEELTTFSVADAKRQTGLGLGLVREAIGVRGGWLWVGRSPEGGARVLMVAPLEAGKGPQAPVRPSSVLPSPVSVLPSPGRVSS
jgi:two-component system OmpR family sensor kinase